MPRYSKSLWDNAFFGFAVSVGFGVICGLFLCVILSAVSYFVFNGMMFSGIFDILSLSVSAYSAGYICGRYRRRRGLIDGALCGAVIYFVLVAISLFLGGFTNPFKLLLLAIAGAVGGVAGVNSKRPKNLY